MLIGQELVNQLKTVEKVQIERWKFKLIDNAPSTRSTMIFVQFRIMMNILIKFQSTNCARPTGSSYALGIWQTYVRERKPYFMKLQKNICNPLF